MMRILSLVALLAAVSISRCYGGGNVIGIGKGKPAPFIKTNINIEADPDKVRTRNSNGRDVNIDTSKLINEASRRYSAVEDDIDEDDYDRFITKKDGTLRQKPGSESWSEESLISANGRALIRKKRCGGGGGNNDDGNANRARRRRANRNRARRARANKNNNRRVTKVVTTRKVIQNGQVVSETSNQQVAGGLVASGGNPVPLVAAASGPGIRAPELHKVNEGAQLVQPVVAPNGVPVVPAPPRSANTFENQPTNVPAGAPQQPIALVKTQPQQSAVNVMPPISVHGSLNVKA